MDKSINLLIHGVNIKYYGWLWIDNKLVVELNQKSIHLKI